MYNRLFAMQHLRKLKRENRSFSISFIDIDFLKYCNDEFGHSTGDAYILSIADLLKNAFSSDVVCKVGGDEFLAISLTRSEQEMIDILSARRSTLR